MANIWWKGDDGDVWQPDPSPEGSGMLCVRLPYQYKLPFEPPTCTPGGPFWLNSEKELDAAIAYERARRG